MCDTSALVVLAVWWKHNSVMNSNGRILRNKYDKHETIVQEKMVVSQQN